jgi:hypothetical protein
MSKHPKATRASHRSFGVSHHAPHKARHVMKMETLPDHLDDREQPNVQANSMMGMGAVAGPQMNEGVGPPTVLPVIPPLEGEEKT